MTATEILLREAARAAEHSPLRVRVGAFADGRGSDYAVSWNSRKTHPALKKLGLPSWSNRHAEMGLVLGTEKRWLRGRHVYVARLLRNGEWALARPCPWCMKVLAWEGVAGVTWTTGPGAWETLELP